MEDKVHTLASLAYGYYSTKIKKQNKKNYKLLLTNLSIIWITTQRQTHFSSKTCNLCKKNSIQQKIIKRPIIVIFLENLEKVYI